MTPDQEQPAGEFVMVPREPTWEMADHALLTTAIDDHASRGSYNAAVYRAMIEAALAASPAPTPADAAPHEPTEYLSKTWLEAVARDCGLRCDMLSQLFDFSERVQRATLLAARPKMSADGGKDIPL